MAYRSPMSTLHEFTVRTIDGTTKSLGDFKGDAALVVNVASECGLTPQYAALEQIFRKYNPQGLQVLGFPCNQFGGQEPGDEAQIRSFCTSRYEVTFPMFAKVDVNDQNRAPVFAWLTDQATGPEASGDIRWNFGKFLVNRKGQLVARFSPKTEPTSPEVTEAIERALAEPG